MASRTSKVTAFKSLSSPYGEVLEYLGLNDPSESDSILDAGYDATRQFLKEYQENNELDEIPPEVEEAVGDAIGYNVATSVHEKTMESLTGAIHALANEAEAAVGERGGAAFGDIGYDSKTGDIHIEVGPGFLPLWQNAVEGMGYAAWGGDESLAMLKTIRAPLSILEDMAEVYGFRNIRSRYLDGWDRWEPDTGNYWDLVKIADAARGIKPKRKRR